jgi:hypothetical protein
MDEDGETTRRVTKGLYLCNHKEIAVREPHFLGIKNRGKKYNMPFQEVAQQI